LNARLANVVAKELDLNPQRFKTIEGNALKQLPTVPPEIETSEQTIICTRFVPTLTQEEIDALIGQIRNNIGKMPGYAILTYSTLSLQDWEKPHTVILRGYLQAVKNNVLKIKTITGQNKELLGVSFISLIDNRDSKLVAGATYQTFLFKEKISQFFAERKCGNIKQIPIGEENFIQREAAILTSGK
jgi:hypothetical protein